MARMAKTDTSNPASDRRNYQIIFWSGSFATIGSQLVNPQLVLPFLYLALGAPAVVAGLLLPFVTGARLISEIFVSPFVNRITRAKVAVYASNLVTGLILAVVAVFATDLPQVMVVLLFLLTSIVMGLCQGLSTIGVNQVYGASIQETKRNRMFFAQATVSGLLVIAVVWLTKDLLASDQPMQRHIVVMWCGILALFAAGISFAGVRLLEAADPVPQKPQTKISPVRELATGLKTGLAYDWFRKFLVARLLFLSVELAMPFYTIHAATLHLGTKHALSYFVIAASGGAVIGSLLWGWVSSRFSVKPTMVLGSLIAAGSAVLALTFVFTGMAQNVWHYALVILLLSLGGNGVSYGRYLYLISMTKASERPYLVALGDVCAGLVGVAFAAALGFVAHLHDPATPLFALGALNAVAILFALRLSDPGQKNPSQQN